jgi:DNA-binding LytR/AlgR family response regulator
LIYPYRGIVLGFNKPQLCRLVIKKHDTPRPLKTHMENYYIKRKDFLPTAEIAFLEAAINYTLIYLYDGKKVISTRTLKRHEECLKGTHFLRVNKSYLLNVFFIESYFQKNESSFVRLKNGKEIQVSRRRKINQLNSQTPKTNPIL